ncbi:hypothetical protein [Brevundimonas bullata]|uniref:hypothetical protein n=1 Tax=Brevundimonas bullata TaxID=13160 RepID=UPI002FDB0B23
MTETTGLFLGAGASYELGMPLVWELTEELKRWLTPKKLRQFNSNWTMHGSGLPEAVIEDLAQALVRPELHYEAILGFLEVQFRRRNDDIGEAYHTLYSWLVEVVYHLLWHRQVKNASFLSAHLSLFDGFKALVERETSLWVFSLNHDVMVEMIAARLSIPIHHGFGTETVALPRRDATGRKIGDIRGLVLPEVDIASAAMRFPYPAQPGINLLKIHGALDIFTFRDGKDLLKLVPEGVTPADVAEVLRAANQDLIYAEPRAPGGQFRVLNEIAYANDAGEMQFLRRTLLAGAFKFDTRSNQVLPRQLLDVFRGRLDAVGKLVCIGYGFGDLHINDIIRRWLETSAERRLEVVNPGPNVVPANLLHLAPQVTLAPISASAWFDQYAGITRTPEEQVRSRLSMTLRRLGPEGAQKAQESFVQAMRKRWSNDLAEALRALPMVDGRPDFSAIGDPRAWTERRFGADPKTPEAFNAALLAFLESPTEDQVEKP